MELTKEEIQRIIDYEVVVDCYTEEEANMGWAIYMGDNINYPFEAEYLMRWRDKESEWKKVLVVSNETDEDSFDGESYYVELELEDGMLIPANIEGLRNVEADKETMITIQVWKNRHNY